MNTTSKKGIETQTVSAIQIDGTLVELLLDADASATSLLCAKGEVVTTVQLFRNVSTAPMATLPFKKTV